MSLVHVRLTRIKNLKPLVEYLVESPDLGNSSDWAIIGNLQIDKIKNKYEFTPSELWIKKKGMPPSFYAQDENMQKKLLNGFYSDFGWGIWAELIHHYAMSFMEKSEYPENHPTIFFE